MFPYPKAYHIFERKRDCNRNLVVMKYTEALCIQNYLHKQRTNVTYHFITEKRKGIHSPKLFGAALSQ